jgi:hypothetical protein
MPTLPAWVGFGHQHFHVLPDHFGGGVAEDAFRPGIECLHDSIFVDADNAVQDILEDGPQVRLALFQHPIGPAAFHEII